MVAIHNQHAYAPRAWGRHGVRHGPTIHLHVNWYRVAVLVALIGFWAVIGAAVWRLL